MNDDFKQNCIEFLLGRKDELSRTRYFLPNSGTQLATQVPSWPRRYFDDNIVKHVLPEVKYCEYEEAVIYALTWNSNTVNP